MSTRCQTKVIESQKESTKKYNEDITLYHHCDGYPESMVPLFWEAHQFGVTPRVNYWEKNNPKAEKKDSFAWQTFRGGYASSYLCSIDPTGFQPENSHELHGDISWYYKLYVIGKTVDGQKSPQWEVEIFKAKIKSKGSPTLKKVLNRTPLCNLVDKKGELKVDILNKIKEKIGDNMLSPAI